LRKIKIKNGVANPQSHHTQGILSSK